MPWKLVPPRQGKTPFYYVRGKYLGITLDRSTGASEAGAARRIIKTWREQAERGEFDRPQTKPSTGALMFPAAAEAYMLSGGDGQYLEPILKRWPGKSVVEIDQTALDTLAADLYPRGTAQTRNRQVHTPVIAVIHHSGSERKFKRPKGWKGKKATSWLEPEQAFALFAAADSIEPEFGLFCRFLCYTGLRLSEGLSRKLSDLKLDRAFIYLDDSKNEDPRGCHLPPVLVRAFKEQPPRKARMIAVIGRRFAKGDGGRAQAGAGVPFLKRDGDSKLFRYHASGHLRGLLAKAMKAAGLRFPRRQGGFHIFCHTYGSWMHRYGELDTHGLTRTGRWSDPDSADRYVHTGASEEARRADWLPTPKRGQGVERKAGKR